MEKSNKLGYIIVIAILGVALIGGIIAFVNLFNQNRTMKKILETSCKTTVYEQQCLDAVDIMINNPDMIDTALKYYRK